MEAIGANSLGTLILKVHLKSVQKFFLSKVVTCVSLFEHLTEKSLNRLHESILERLHDHSFNNIIFYLPFDLHQTCMKLCVKLSSNVWLLAHLVIPFLCLPQMFSPLHCTLSWFFPIL
jgi:hypothetical protein